MKTLIINVILLLTSTALTETIFLGPTDSESKAFTSSTNGQKGFYVIHGEKIYWCLEGGNINILGTITEKTKENIAFKNKLLDDSEGNVIFKEEEIIFHYGKKTKFPMTKIKPQKEILDKIKKRETK